MEWIRRFRHHQEGHEEDIQSIINFAEYINQANLAGVILCQMVSVSYQSSDICTEQRQFRPNADELRRFVFSCICHAECKGPSIANRMDSLPCFLLIMSIAAIKA